MPKNYSEQNIILGEDFFLFRSLPPWGMFSLSDSSKSTVTGSRGEWGLFSIQTEQQKWYAAFFSSQYGHVQADGAEE